MCETKLYCYDQRWIAEQTCYQYRFHKENLLSWGFFTPKYHHNTYFQHGGTFYWSTIFKWQLSSNQAQYNLKSSTTGWQLCCWGCGHIHMLYPHSSSRYTERELTSRIFTYNRTIPLIVWLCIFKTTLASEFLTNCELRDVIRFLSGKMLNWLTLFIGPLEWRNIWLSAIEGQENCRRAFKDDQSNVYSERWGR